MHSWKNYWNRTTFAKVIMEIEWLCFDWESLSQLSIRLHVTTVSLTLILTTDSRSISFVDIIISDDCVMIDGDVASSAVSDLRHSRRHFSVTHLPTSRNNEPKIANNSRRSGKLRQKVQLFHLCSSFHNSSNIISLSQDLIVSCACF